MDQFGFPLISKETALKVRKLRHGNLSDRYRNYLLYGDERGKFGVLAKKWRFFLATEYEISEKMLYYFEKGTICQIRKRNWQEALYWNYAR